MSSFYTKVFGWKTEQMGPEMGNYVVVTTAKTEGNRSIQPGAINGGFYQRTEADSANQYPSVVISVEDIHATIEKIKKAGGKIHGEIQDIPGIGKFVSMIDTEGNRVSVMQFASQH
jgi:predicted enzyme related to lactoylglutathione lyase